ncbi:MAG: TIGR04222 domain-containing membrane protein, partial [Pseudonocardia sp.]
MDAATPLAWSTFGGPGDTWGVSGPAFLVLYLMLAAAVWIAGAQARRGIVARPLGRPGVDPGARPYDLALLNGGRELAVDAALAAMHQSGTVVPRSGKVGASGRLDARADDLERAVHAAATTPVTRARLRHHRSVGLALDAVQARLVAGGLLLSEADRRRYRAVGWWMVAVAGLGLVRLLAGVAAAKPVGYLLIAMVAAAVVGLVQLAGAPRRTRAGDEVLRALRAEHHVLSPTMRPDWTTYGAGAAALGVGLFGLQALWASDPAFAGEIALQRAAAAGGSSGTTT